MTRARIAILAAFVLAVAACGGKNSDLVIYAAVDPGTAAPLIEAFEARTGCTVALVFDAETAKTAALARRVALEKDAPRADVWWSGEALFTAWLDAQGAFEARPDAPPDGAIGGRGWTGFALRLRVLVYRPDRWPRSAPPRALADLADPTLRGRCAIARPLAGTSATHAAHLLGTSAGRTLLTAILDNEPLLVAGNAHAVRAVVEGQALLALTDSDDAAIARAEGAPIAIVVPTDPGGAVSIPSSVAVIRGARHPELARAFAAFASGPEGERLLAASPARHWPLAREVAPPPGEPPLASLDLAPIDLVALAASFEERRAEIERLLDR